MTLAPESPRYGSSRALRRRLTCLAERAALRRDDSAGGDGERGEGRAAALAGLNLADPGVSPDNADAAAAMTDFPVLTLVDAPIRRRKAGAQ